MSFLQLMRHLEHKLGHHQVPLNPCARTPADLFVSCGVHDEFLKTVTHAIYKQNRCQNLLGALDAERTLAALVPLRLKVLQSDRTDIDLFQFTEALCAAVDGYFRRESTDIMTAPALPLAAQVLAFPARGTLKSSA